MQEVRIPYGVDHKRFKIVLTTRTLDVCTQMDSSYNVEVGVFSEKESWNFFQNVAGNVMNSHNLHKVAQDVCKECGGLPLAVVTLGRALRHKEADIWSAAANENI